MMDTQEVLDKTSIDMKRVKDWDRLKTEIEEMKQSLNRRTDAELKKALIMVIDRMTEMEEEE